MEQKVIIADSDPAVRQMLKDSIQFKELGLTLAGTAEDGKVLLSMLASAATAIVITDTRLPVLDGLTVISSARQMGFECRFVLMSEQRQFETAYQAVKLHVDDYLLKPLNVQELHHTLGRIKHEMDLLASDEKSTDFQAVVNRLFFAQAKVDFRNRPSSLEVINDTYGTRFSKASFRFAFIKFIYSGLPTIDSFSISSRLKKCTELIYSAFSSCCNEVLVDQNYMLLYVLFNYASNNDGMLRDKLQECLLEIKCTMLATENEDVTFGISLPFTDIGDTRKAWSEAADAVWSRFANGTGKVIYWKPEEKLPIHIQNKLDAIEKNLKIACSLIDLDEFKHSIGEFFAMPIEILSRYATRVFLRAIENYMFDTNRELISFFADADLLQQGLVHALRKANTLEEYKDCYISHMTFILTQISDQANVRKSKPIRQARYFIEQNFSRDINLSDIAEHVGFSPVYFSYLFKKETGENVTDYINNRRILFAKEMLSNSKEKINEISLMAGFASPKYFSKTFKKIEGITPVDYRKRK